jgi:type VI secretion system secreted protein VgrG
MASRRRLTAHEIAEARLVFGHSLEYQRAIVVERTEFPNLVARLGRSPTPNAVALGNTCYFPETLRTGPEFVGNGDLRAMAWLIHELAHVWQYQRMGWSYLARTLWVHAREGQRGYRYRIEPGRRLADYNLEQQGDIARDYYCALKSGWNCTRSVNRNPADWEPLVADFRAAASR